MVNILWKKGNVPAAICLEEMWNKLIQKHSFTLFCAYSMDSLDPDTQETMLKVCNSHSHFFSAKHPEQFNKIVDQASQEILGSSMASKMSAFVSQQQTRAKMPKAQNVIFWLYNNMPKTADKVLLRMKDILSSAQDVKTLQNS